MDKNQPEIKDIEVDGNTVRFKKPKALKVNVQVPMVNVRKSEEGELGIVVGSGVKKVTRGQPSKGVKEVRPNLGLPTPAYHKAYEEAFKLRKREKSFQIETIMDTHMSMIYELLDKCNVPIDNQLKIHHEITEMLNVMGGCK